MSDRAEYQRSLDGNDKEFDVLARRAFWKTFGACAFFVLVLVVGFAVAPANGAELNWRIGGGIGIASPCVNGQCPLTVARPITRPMVPAARQARPTSQPRHPAIVRIISRLKNSSRHGNGTHIGRGRILTCAHILRGGWTASARDGNGREWPARIVDTNALYDLALLQVDQLADAPAMGLSKGEPRQGERVFWRGESDGRWHGGEATVLGYMGNWIHIRAQAPNGTSGGPIYDGTGLVSVLSYVTNADGSWATSGPSIGVIERWMATLTAPTVERDPPLPPPPPEMSDPIAQAPKIYWDIRRRK